MTPQDCIYFYSNTAFSNFHKSTFTMSHSCIGKPNDVFSYPTSEHAIMHLKACLMGDDDIADKILSCDKPLQAKRLGRRVKPWDEAKWKSNVANIAYEVLLAKFTSKEALARKLRDTKGKVLAEASATDKIWGIGLGLAKAKAGETWKGENLLGVSLMKVRDAI